MQNLKTIFIIDDDFDDREMFQEAVAYINSSIKCHEFSNGADALEILKKTEHYPDIIFLDLNMPRVSGKQCLHQIKSESSIAQIPVVIYTTSNQVEDKKDTEALGASYFLTKPVTVKELRDNLLEIFALFERQGSLNTL